MRRRGSRVPGPSRRSPQHRSSRWPRRARGLHRSSTSSRRSPFARRRRRPTDDKLPPSAAPAAAPAPGGLAVAPPPKVDFAKFGPIDTKPLTRIQKIAGPGLHRNWVTIPHVTNHEDADITDLEAFRLALNKEQEVKVTLLAFLMKASVAALQKFANLNSSLEGDHLVLKKYWNIGFAADTPQGLVVPVVKEADKKGVLVIAKETGNLAAKARDGKLSPADMQGATFTISSLGGIGGTYFTPIINAP